MWATQIGWAYPKAQGASQGRSEAGFIDNTEFEVVCTDCNDSNVNEDAYAA